MKVWISLLALVLGLSFVTPTMAAKGGKKGVRGKVTSFTGDASKGSLTVTSGGKKNPQDVTVETDDKTSVTLDGNPAKVTDLKSGLWVTVSPAEGTAATITASTTRPERKKASDSSDTTKKDDAGKSGNSSSKTGDSSSKTSDSK
jgi:hypothetical protein